MPDLVPHVLPVGVLHRRTQPVLTAGDLRLRPWEDCDAPAPVAASADPGVQHWNGASLDEAEAQRCASGWAEPCRAEHLHGRVAVL